MSMEQPTMTRSTPVEEQLAPSDAGTRAKKRRTELFQICWLVSLSSLLISLYASLVLPQHLAPADCQHCLNQAALVIADELGRLNVRHKRFGNVGLSDISEGTRSQMGLNRLEATLRLDAIAAAQLGYNGLAELVRTDARDASRIEHDLAHMERDLINPAANSRMLGRSSFTEVVRRVLSQTGAGGRLKSLKITLGGLKTSRFGSRTPLPSVPGEQSAPHADFNNYRVHVPVKVMDDITYHFYELADGPSLITSLSQFTEDIPQDAVASVVLLTAEFEVGRGSNREIKTMTSCAIAGAPPSRQLGSVFMLSFPQGYFSGITCLEDLFCADKFEKIRGEWYQAFGGEVPGDGLLIQAPADSPKMSPDTAAVNIFYHFIFNVGPSLVPANLKMLMKEPLATLQVNSDELATGNGNFNSGLFRDTGSARFALERQSTGAEGKRVLSSAFSSREIDTFMPPSTFPLLVDSSGTLNLPQETGFDRERVRDFLDALYKTNIAGIETMQIGTTIVQRMQSSINQSLKEMASLREELRSVRQSLESLSAGQKNDAERQRLTEQAASLEKSLKEEQERQAASAKIKDKAAAVVLNGKEAARTAYEIGSHMSSFVGKGLRRITRPYPAYLLSRALVFIPHTQPVEEDELYDAASSSAAPEAGRRSGLMSWTSQDFAVTREPDPEMFVDKNPITDYWQTPPLQHTNRPLFVMMTSNELLSRRSPSLFGSHLTPFDNGSIARSQLFYFAPQSMATGAHKDVTWSVLARDLVYSMIDGDGKPLLSLNPRWCLELGMDEETCPGLAVEFQIRTPIPKYDANLSGAYLQDPNGGPSVALYPPLPIDMI